MKLVRFSFHSNHGLQQWCRPWSLEYQQCFLSIYFIKLLHFNSVHISFGSNSVFFFAKNKSQFLHKLAKDLILTRKFWIEGSLKNFGHHRIFYALFYTFPVSLLLHFCIIFMSPLHRFIQVFVANCVIMSSLAFSVLYGMSMKPGEAETWLNGQFLNVLIDVLLMPIIKITISGVIVVYFLKDHFEKYSNIMMNRIRKGIYQIISSG